MTAFGDPEGYFSLAIIAFGAFEFILHKYYYRLGKTDLFSRRFREGISFPNFLERSILKLPISELCIVPFALQNRALFKGENRAKRCPEKGRKRGGQKRGQKGNKDA